MSVKRPNMYQNYSVNDFDSYDCLKLSKGFYFTLAFVLRGYIIWIMSVTNMRDRVDLIQWVYPQQSLFLLSLLSGAVGLFVVLVISLRRPGAALWVEKSWKKSRVLLLVALFFDFAVSLFGYFYWQLLSINWLMSEAVIIFLLVTFCFKSKKMEINISEFPQEVPKD